MNNAKRVALEMVGLAGLEAWPLSLIALASGGPMKLLQAAGIGGPPVAFAAWATAIAVAIAYAGASAVSLPYIRRRALDLTGLKLLAVPFALITGAFEELFFRRWLMDLLEGRGIAVAAQVVVSALAFGLVHGIWGLFGRNWRAAISATVWTGALGVALAVVYVLASRNVAPCIWSHVLINLLIEPWLLLGVMERARPSAAPASA